MSYVNLYENKSLTCHIFNMVFQQPEQQGEEALSQGPGSPRKHWGLPARGHLLLHSGPGLLGQGDPGQPTGTPPPQLRDLLLHRHGDPGLPLLRTGRRGEEAQLGGEHLIPEQRGLRRGVRQPCEPAELGGLPQRTQLHRLEPAGQQGHGEMRRPGWLQTHQQLQRGYQWITQHTICLFGIQGGCNHCQR